MEGSRLNWIANFIWGVADDVLRDLYVRGKYRDVILPMTVLRRLDSLLELSQPAVLEMKTSLDNAKIIHQDQALRQAAGQSFYNTSKFTLRDLKARSSQQQLKADFEVPWCITLDNSKGISRLRFWAKNRRVNGINDLPVFMHQGNDVPATVLNDEEAVQQPERRGGHGEQIHGGDIVFMVAQESHPSFQLVGLRGTPRQVSRHRDLGDDETELGELSMDAWRPQPSCAIVRTRRRISASIRGRPGWRRCEIFAQYRRNRSRCQRATVSAWTMSRRLAHTGHESRRATQKARSVSSSGGRGRSFFSAVTCCRKATFSNTRSARRRHIARMTRTPSETRKTTTSSIAAEFRRLRPGIQAERKSLISWAEQF